MNIHCPLYQFSVHNATEDIGVYHADKGGYGLTTQLVAIHYNCTGVFAAPDRKHIPEVDVLMETGKGAAVSYSPARIA